MQWLQSNWIWVLLGFAVLAMHLFGHGGHGKSHGSGAGPGQRDGAGRNDAMAGPGAGHTHAGDNARGATSPTDPAPGSAPALGGPDAVPAPADGRRHRHGC
jgi:hypothetical protein